MWLSRIYRFFPTKTGNYRRKMKMIASSAVSFLYPPYCITHKIKRSNINEDIIVSLTSYPARINQLHLTVQSILRQSMNAGKVILYLALSDFPDKVLPTKLEQLKQYGLEIKFVDEDLKSYKKFYYSALRYPDKIIITADDDVLYPEDWIENLYKTHLSYPNCVVCFRAHEMTYKEDGSIQKYNNWIMHSPKTKGPSPSLVATGMGGILYPSKFFKKEDLKDKPFMELAPTADDLWLKIIAMKNGYDVVKVSGYSYYWFETKDSQKTSLKSVNIHGENLNDTAMKNLQRYYLKSQS